MKIYTVGTPKSYEQNGEQKTFWHNVGTVRFLDNGKAFLELNMFPNQTFILNELKPKENSKQQAPVAESSDQDEITVENIPF